MKRISTILLLILVAIGNYSCNKNEELQPEEKLAPPKRVSSVSPEQEQAYLNLLNSDPDIVYQWEHKKFTEDLSDVLLLSGSLTNEYKFYNNQVIRRDRSSVIDFICADYEAWGRFIENSAAYAEAADYFRGQPEPTYKMSAREMQIWSEIEAELSSDFIAPSDCKGTKHIGNINFQGTLEHWMIQLDFLAGGYLSGNEVEYQIPESSSSGNTGRADMVNRTSGEIYEIKPNNEAGIDAGEIEVARYVSAANLHCGTGWKAGNNYLTRALPMPRGGGIIAELRKPGVITYRQVSQTPQLVPVPQDVLDRLKNMVQRIKDNYPEFQLEVARFFKDSNNKVLLTFLKSQALSLSVAIIVGTLAEDVVSGGAGIADDAASFLLAYKIARFAITL